MIRHSGLILTFLVVAGVSAKQLPAVDPGDNIFEIENGYLEVEIEDVDSSQFHNGKWELANVYEQYSGSGYAIWNGSAIQGNESQPDDDQERYLTFHVRVATPGTYFIKLLNYHHRRDGDNDVFVRSPGRETQHYLKYYDHDTNVWSYDETSYWATHELSAGIHAIEIVGRSHGFAIDKIVIYHENAVFPQVVADKTSLPQTQTLLNKIACQRYAAEILKGVSAAQAAYADKTWVTQSDPVICGIESGIEPARQKELIDLAVHLSDQGRIVLFDSPGFLSDEKITVEQLIDMTTPSSPAHERWLHYWNGVSEVLSALKARGIVALVRPISRANRFISDSEGEVVDHPVTALYRQTFTFLTRDKGLDNVLWLFNGSDDNLHFASAYPGDPYVDILEVSISGKEPGEACYQALRKLAGEKAIALVCDGPVDRNALTARYPEFVYCLFRDKRTASSAGSESGPLIRRSAWDESVCLKGLR